MFSKSQFGIVFNTLFSIAFSAMLTLFIQFRTGGLTLESFCTGFIPSFTLNFTLGSYIPLVRVGNAFASLFTKEETSPIFYCLRIFAIVAIMVAAMSFLLMFCEMGFTAALPVAFVMSLPMTFLFAYVAALILFPFLLKATIRLCAKEG